MSSSKNVKKNDEKINKAMITLFDDQNKLATLAMKCNS